MVNKINRTFWKRRKEREIFTFLLLLPSFLLFSFLFFFPFFFPSHRFLSSSRKIDRVNENIGISLLGNFVASSSCKTCLIDGSPRPRTGNYASAYRPRRKWRHGAIPITPLSAVSLIAFSSVRIPGGKKTCLFFARSSAIARGLATIFPAEENIPPPLPPPPPSTPSSEGEKKFTKETIKGMVFSRTISNLFFFLFLPHFIPPYEWWT